MQSERSSVRQTIAPRVEPAVAAGWSGVTGGESGPNLPGRQVPPELGESHMFTGRETRATGRTERNEPTGQATCATGRLNWFADEVRTVAG